MCGSMRVVQIMEYGEKFKVSDSSFGIEFQIGTKIWNLEPETWNYVIQPGA